MTITPMNLRSLRSVADGVALAQLLGYDAPPAPIDGTQFWVAADAVRFRSHASQSRGFGVFVGTVDAKPRSLKSFGRRLIDTLHDHPLAILGVRGAGTEWSEAIVVRPRLIVGGGGALDRQAHARSDPTDCPRRRGRRAPPVGRD